MNSIKTELTILNDYLKTSKFTVQSVRVLENAGEFDYIIKFPQFNEFDITLSLQVPAGKSLKESTVIINFTKKLENKLTKSEIDTLKTTISNLLKDNEEFLLKHFFIECYKLIEEACKSLNENEKPKKDTKAAKQTQKKESTIKNVDVASNDVEDTKKCSMKTAADVVNRIHWDEKINREYITVGYLDRFLGIKECEFNKFDWGDIVLADLGALAIPEHRIQYFKYKNELIWDKNQRFDNVYGSTGSNITIYDVIEKLEGVEITNDVDEEAEDEVQQQSTLTSHEKPTTATTTKTQPNYFLSIPIDNKEIQLNFAKLSKDLCDSEPECKEMLLPETSLHLTLITLRIDSLEDKNLVIKTLDNMKNNGSLNQFLPLCLKFKNIGNFYDKVLHIKCDCEFEKLNGLRNFLLNEFKKENISLAGNYYDFVPHLTVLKLNNKYLNRNAKTKRDLSDYVNKSLLDKYDNYYFGKQLAEELELCKMIDIFSCLTYPVEHTIKLID